MANGLAWFKLYSEIIHDPKIRRLGVDERWFWIVLLCLAAKSDDRHVTLRDARASVCVTPEIPYTEHELAELCGYSWNDQINGEIDPAEMVKNALYKFEKLRMIERDENGIIYIKNFQKRQDTHLSEAERAKRYRENKKNVTTVTQPDVTTVTLDKIREEKNREEKNLSHKKPHMPAHMEQYMENENENINKIGEESQREEERSRQKAGLNKPVVDMSIELLAQREGKLKAGINLAREAEACLDYYTARGTQVEDWQAAFRNWVRNWFPPAILAKHPKNKTPAEIHQDNLSHVKQMLRGVK